LQTHSNVTIKFEYKKNKTWIQINKYIYDKILKKLFSRKEIDRNSKFSKNLFDVKKNTFEVIKKIINVFFKS